MAVLNNTGILMGSSAVTAAAAADDYQIEKGLRFNGADDPYLHRDPSHWGDSRLWTLSCWVKRSKLDASARQDFFSARGGLSDHFYIGFTNDAIKWWKNGDDSDTGCTTNALFRDPSAWMHVVFVWDTAQATAADRTRLYVNGKRITSFSSATYPAQYEKGKVSRPSVAHQFGAYDNGDYYNFEGYIADPHFIDGLGLSPAAFGQWNSASNWDPKTFALPAPNNGTTWSSTWSDTPDAGSAAGVFNGKLDTSTYWNSAGERTLTTGTFTINNSLRVYSNFNESTVYFKINDVYTPAMPDCGGFSWDEIDLSNHTLPLTVTSLKYKNIGLSGVSFKGFEVDGVQLVDGKTDQTWDEYVSSDTINNGVLRSEEVTSETGSFYGSNLKVNLFDGRHQVDGGSPSNVDASSSGKWVNWTPSYPFPFNSKVEVAVASNGNTIKLKRVGQGSTDDITTANAPNTWHTVYTGSGHIEYIQNQAASGGYNNWEAIRIDGVILKDWKHNANSFQLKLSDTSLNRYLGKDTLNGKIEDATGGLPILNTSDDYGDIKGSGYRADSSAGTTDGTGLVLAITGEGSIADVHHNINTGSSAKTIGTQGDTTVSTEQSRFYGSSIKFDGTGDYLTLSDSSDFEFGTGAYTVECWVRHTSVSGQQTYVSDPGGNTAGIYFYKDSSHKLGLYYSGQIATGATALGIDRWYHIAIVRNSGRSTLYLNGLNDGSGSDTTDLTNGNLAFAADSSGGSGEFTGYMSDLRIYKGVAKYTTNFIPPRRNDFKVNNLTEADSSNPKNIDSLTDTPTNYGEDTGAGGEVRGNYCTMNALDKGSAVTLTQGNLYVTTPSGNTSWDTRKTVGTMAMNGNKFYYEQEIVVKDTNICVGVVQDSPNANTSSLGFLPTGYAYYSVNGDIWNNGSNSSYGDSYGAGDIISIAFDGNTGTLWFAKNGTWQNSATKSEIAAGTTTNAAYTGIATDMRACFSVDEGCESSFNFGQRAWKYPSSVPSDFKAVCTQNLPDTFSGDEVNNPSKYFDIKLWDGDSQDDREIKGLKFGPDLIWNKIRNEDGGARMIDILRGSDERLLTHQDVAQTDNDNEIQEFRDDGFQIGNRDEINDSGNTYVAWCWDGGTSTASNTDGDITASVRASPAGGTSIIKFTSNDTDNQKVGHGLNAAPSLIIIKNIDATEDWWVIHEGCHASDPWNDRALFLNSTAAITGSWGTVNNVAPTSTVVNISNSTNTAPNDDTNDKIMYCFAPVPGFSAFGGYDGGGGKPFIYTGFRPYFIIIRATTTGRNWVLIDGKRFPHNGDMDALYANSNVAEQNHNVVDIVSNGFNIIDDGTADYNVDDQITYAAWAEHPLKTARAR